jgi:hypothetical protein
MKKFAPSLLSVVVASFDVSSRSVLASWFYHVGGQNRPASIATGADGADITATTTPATAVLGFGMDGGRARRRFWIWSRRRQGFPEKGDHSDGTGARSVAMVASASLKTAISRFL